nr:hypothetical protein [Marinicella sp. W31]MDC2876050.1 hypothetical protein [Marinicella sp. W31]
MKNICENVAESLRQAFRALARLPGLRHLFWAYKIVGRWTHHRLPRGLFARSLLIIIIPMLLLQAVVATVFMERHWQMVTRRLADAVTGDIAAIIDLIDTTDADYQEEIVSIAARDMGLRVAIEPGGKLPPPLPKPFLACWIRCWRS